MVSEGCAECHSNAPEARAMRDPSGALASPYDLWRGSMMANASRDPVWRAAVAAEVARFPSRRQEIESDCMRCHAPMASVQADGLLGRERATDLLDGAGVWSELARDGVSCTICHQIEPEGLGSAESFSGGLRLNRSAHAYGPHPDPFRNPMRMVTSFTPTHGPHVLESALCATCHTLFTEALDEAGRPSGRHFAEQTAYLEWRNSAYSTEGERPGVRARSCQGCHLPVRDENGARLETAIARSPDGPDFPRTEPRAPFGRHLFVGGNAFVLELLRDHADLLGVDAPPEAFDRSIAATREQLERRTANLQLRPRRVGERLELAVELRNLCGHKFPTGHPSRRAWLRLLVRDAAGRMVFASGQHDAQGRLVGADGAPLAFERVGGPIAPHLQHIASASEVAIYESVAADLQGRPTFRVLDAAAHAKDNRLLPLGWRSEGAQDPAIRPQGVEGDPDFTAGGDVVFYEVEAPAAAGPYRVEAELLFQPLGARWLAELLAVEAPEVRRLEGLLEGRPAPPERIAGQVLSVP